MGLTTDPRDSCLNEIEPSGQQKCYLVLSEEERAKGFVRPVRSSYQHLKCGGVTSMGVALAETYARDPNFYGGTFCVRCGSHFDLKTYGSEETPVKEIPGKSAGWGYAFVWVDDGEGVGS